LKIVLLALVPKGGELSFEAGLNYGDSPTIFRSFVSTPASLEYIAEILMLNFNTAEWKLMEFTCKDVGVFGASQGSLKRCIEFLVEELMSKERGLFSKDGDGGYVVERRVKYMSDRQRRFWYEMRGG
jgi:hypothetical protein